jgi:hypothetical protein
VFRKYTVFFQLICYFFNNQTKQMFSALRNFLKRENLTWIGATIVVASAVTYLSIMLPTNQPPAIEKHPRSSEQLDNAIHEKKAISSESTHKQCAENTSASHSDTNRVETAVDEAVAASTSTSDQTNDCEEDDQEEEGKEEGEEEGEEEGKQRPAYLNVCARFNRPVWLQEGYRPSSRAANGLSSGH